EVPELLVEEVRRSNRDEAVPLRQPIADAGIDDDDARPATPHALIVQRRTGHFGLPYASDRRAVNRSNDTCTSPDSAVGSRRRGRRVVVPRRDRATETGGMEETHPYRHAGRLQLPSAGLSVPPSLISRTLFRFP